MLAEVFVLERANLSTSQESSPAKSRDLAEAIIRFLGMGLDQDAIQEVRKEPEITELAKSLSIAITQFLENLLAGLNSAEREILAAPKVPGHEKLLMELVGYSPLSARMMTRLTHRWAEVLAAEINEGRRMRSIIDEIAKTNGRNSLIMSRRAKRFRDECSSLEARHLIDRAAHKADLPLTAAEFYQRAGLACERDENACRDFGRIAEQLAPHLPEKRGRPISVETCIHLFLRRHLQASPFFCWVACPCNLPHRRDRVFKVQGENSNRGLERRDPLVARATNGRWLSMPRKFHAEYVLSSNAPRAGLAGKALVDSSLRSDAVGRAAP